MNKPAPCIIFMDDICKLLNVLYIYCFDNDLKTKINNLNYLFENYVCF